MFSSYVPSHCVTQNKTYGVTKNVTAASIKVENGFFIVQERVTKKYEKLLNPKCASLTRKRFRFNFDFYLEQLKLYFINSTFTVSLLQIRTMPASQYLTSSK